MKASAPALSVAAAVWCSLAACSSGGSCEEIQAGGYPQMEAVAHGALNGIDHSLERIDACADMGEAWTVLHATVTEWPTTAMARRAFEDQGWSWSDAYGRLVSPDGAYEVALAGPARDADGSTSSVLVQFFDARGN